MGCWLVKEEPTKYSFACFLADGRTEWTGVRNYQARNHLRAMRLGDEVVFYHSGKLKAALGTAVVAGEAFADPTAEDSDWSCVVLEAAAAFAEPVPLSSVRKDPAFAECVLVKNSRLSVMPLTAAEYRRFCQLGRARKRAKA